ncbi:MAG: hypothetical protein BAA04_12360 [Firmicutes bacterium ZCTH02-B6]|nr:MAG: hypothetical protein BAA04_12360 [Firmicutes bacterium ZCTH02-B6]
MGFGTRLLGFFRTGSEGAGEPGRRRRLLSILLVVYLVLLAAGAAAINVPLFSRQAAAREQVEQEARRIAGMQRSMVELQQELLRREHLLEELAVRYRALPGAADLPIAMDELRRLPALTGGSVSGVDYSEPRWSGNSGQLETRAAFAGSWPQGLAYIAALDAALPASAVERLTVRLNRQPGRVTVDLSLSVAVIRERPQDKPAWDAAAARARAEVAAKNTAVNGFPFTPGAVLWQSGWSAGLGLPELRLAGIVRQQNGATLALLVYDGEAQLVRPGSRLGEVEVVAVEADGVLVAIAGRSYKLQVGKVPQAL